jgi:imidazole glycerol-phosphate synthase subunit HisF
VAHTRVIPVLLMHNNGLVKSVRFKNYKYVGDPINAVKIFNEKEVDELILLDISATREGRSPGMQHITQIASEAFMPVAYGGGISSLDQIKELFQSGVEKIILNYHAVHNISLVNDAAKWAGSQSVVVSIDVKRNFLGKYRVYVKNASENTGLDPVSFVKKVESAGAGEIFLNSIDRDGTYGGYDLDLIRMISDQLNIPMIACGGASSLNDFEAALSAGASAVAAGSIFVFQRPHNAVLINYPTQSQLAQQYIHK